MSIITNSNARIQFESTYSPALEAYDLDLIFLVVVDFLSIKEFSAHLSHNNKNNYYYHLIIITKHIAIA